jgi:hypothetical protein
MLVNPESNRVSQSWMRRASRELIALRGSSPAWAYRQGLALAVEPTVLSCLALVASENDTPSPDAGQSATVSSFATSASDPVGKAACEWMKTIQQPDASIPVTQRLLKPGWATAYALMLWSRFPGYGKERRRARHWLSSAKGHAFAATEENAHTIGHDPTLIGWPWVAGTHSWIEPTALAILALDREGLSAHPRVQQGISLILDRAIDSGGWNYGNKAVFGKQLRPQPGPTGVALLALANHERSSKKVGLAIDYLRQALPTITASVSLGWGILGLAAHDACPKDADTWLATAYDRTANQSRSAMSLALLLLAAHKQGVSLFLAPSPNSVEVGALRDELNQPTLEHSS